MLNETGERSEENLRTMQKANEEAAAKVPHTTRNERGKVVKQTLENVRIREEAAARCTKSHQKKSAQETSKESQADPFVKCSLMPGREEHRIKAVVGVVCRREVHVRQRKMAKIIANTM